MRLPWDRGGLRTYLMLAGLLAGYVTPWWILFGTPFVLIGMALHVWAKGCLHQQREVTTAGPYRFVRHPFYLANAFLDLGVAVMSGWWVLQVALPIWWLAIYIPTMRKEEAEMTALFGDAYRAYRERVPLLIPFRRPLPAPTGGFSWRNPNLARTELPRAFRFLSYPLMFGMSFSVHSRGLDVLFSPTVFDVMLFSAWVALCLVGEELRRHFKHRRTIMPSPILAGPSRFAVLAGVIAMGAFVTSFEVEAEWALWLPGVALLVLSAIAWKTLSRHLPVAEALLALGLAVLFELPWLAFLLVPLYLGMVLDVRLESTSPVRTALQRAPSLTPASLRAYCLLLSLGIALSVVKELWPG